MDLVKILETVDEFIYEIALWLALTPSTLVKVLVHPQWAYEYVEQELKKEKADRFSQYLSPILFWVIVGILPYFGVLGFLSSITESRVASEVGFRHLLKMDWTNQLLVVIAFVLAGPLEFARRTVTTLGSKVSRETLRMPFYLQCYCFGPAYLILLPFVAILLRYNEAIPSGFLSVLSTASLSLFHIWLCYAEVSVLRAQFNTSIGLAVVCAAKFYVTAFFVLIAIEYLIITLVFPEAWLGVR